MSRNAVLEKRDLFALGIERPQTIGMRTYSPIIIWARRFAPVLHPTIETGVETLVVGALAWVGAT